MEPINDAWEHLIVTLNAEVSKQQQYFKQRGPWQQIPPYSPTALIPQLDAIGRDGWELVSIQPIIMGDNGDIAIGTYGAGFSSRPWTFQKA